MGKHKGIDSMASATSEQYDKVIGLCRSIFMDKMHDYGTAWRILRPSSLTDQLYIKASRIRSLQEKGESRVGEGIAPEFMGIINYSIMALIQLELGPAEDPHMEADVAGKLYDSYAASAKSLMADKNHDYDEAWRYMRVSSLADIILMKLLRVKQIEDHNGETRISEGPGANYLDIINYSVFALIQMDREI